VGESLSVVLVVGNLLLHSLGPLRPTWNHSSDRNLSRPALRVNPVHPTSTTSELGRPLRDPEGTNPLTATGSSPVPKEPKRNLPLSARETRALPLLKQAEASRTEASASTDEGEGNLGEHISATSAPAAQPPVGPDFTIIVLPDTQYYTSSLNGGSPAIFNTQTEWIVSNRGLRNIVFVTHVGDCVQNGDNAGNPVEWTYADEAMHKLEDPNTTLLPEGIPYGIAVGNHDQSPEGSASGTTTFFNQYFGESRFAGRSYYGGHYGANNDNHFELFSASGLDFVIVHLEFDPSANPAVLSWVNSVLQSHSNRRAMVVSHYIINSGSSASFSAQGQAIYDALKGNPNLFLMLSGHVSGEGQRQDTFNGRTVTTIEADYQGRTNGGNGWLRIMEFSPANNQIRVFTYSPYLNQFETDSNSQFTISYFMGDPGPDTDGDGTPDAFDNCPNTVNANQQDSDNDGLGDACDAIPYNSQTTLSSSPNPSVVGQGVTFTATVTAVSPGTGTPSGSVTFQDGANVLGTATLNASGQASLKAFLVTAGSHSIAAQYSGGGQFNGSTSSTFNQVVNEVSAGQVTLVADAHVSSSNKTSNYGSQTTLRVRSGATGTIYRTYLKFHVSGLTSGVTSAKLRLYVTDGSKNSLLVSGTADNWTESTLNWNSAPAIGTQYATAGPFTAGTWKEVTLPASAFAAGNGNYNFVLTIDGTDSGYFSSKEGANPPQLVLSEGGAPSPELVASFTGTPTSGTAPLSVQFDSSTTTGNPTSWSWDFQNDGSVDSTVQNPSFQYNAAGTYTVVLAVSNGSATSTLTRASYITANPASPPPPSDLTVTLAADAQVKSSSPTSNLGTLTTLRTREGTLDNPVTHHSYVKFDVAGLQGMVTSAKLRLYSTASNTAGVAVFATDNTWTETGITWNNAPPLGMQLANSGPLGANIWVEIPLPASLFVSNGTYSLALAGLSSSSAYFSSREGGNGPQLVLTTVP